MGCAGLAFSIVFCYHGLWEKGGEDRLAVGCPFLVVNEGPLMDFGALEALAHTRVWVRTVVGVIAWRCGSGLRKPFGV